MTTTEQKVQPARFWINSEGEYGVEFVDGTERMNESINIPALASELGKEPGDLTSDDYKRAWDADLRRVVSDHREALLYRMFEHLAPLRGSTFRFWGQFVWVKAKEGNLDEGPHLFMDVEYVLPDKDVATLEALNFHAKAFGAEVEEMWSQTYRGFHKATDVDRPAGTKVPEQGESNEFWEYVPHELEGQTATQYAVTFDVYGKSLPEVAAVQSAWLTATESLWVNYGVNVL